MALTTRLLSDATWDDFAALVEANNGKTADRKPQRGAYLHTGPEELFTGYGFVRDRKIAKWRWVMRADVPPAG